MTYTDTQSHGTSSSGPASSASRAGAGDRQHAHEYPEAEAVRQRAQRTVERVREDARHQATETVATQKRLAAEHISGLASALRETAGQLREQRQQGLARYTDYCAEDVDRMAAWLRDSDAETLVKQTRNFARRRPDVFIGGAVAAGFLLARLLKSSGHRTSSGSARDSSSSEGSTPDAGAATQHPASRPTSTIDTV